MSKSAEPRRRRATSLLCLDLRVERVTQDGGWIAPASLVLTHARGRRWRVAHTHCRGVGASGPLPGCEPLTSEPVYSAPGLSAFESEGFRTWAEEAGGRLYVIGSVFGLAGAATVVSAQLLKIPLTLIPEACGEAADHEKPSVPHLRAQIAVLSRSAPLAEVVGRRTSSSVIRLTPRRAGVKRPSDSD